MSDSFAPEPETATHMLTARDCLRLATNDDDRLRPGDAVGELTVVRHLSSGGMCDVYEAEQGGGLSRRVVLRVMQDTGLEEDRRRFVHEGELQAGAGLHHQGILPVYAAGRDGDRVFLVLPFVRGANLREFRRAARAAVGGGQVLDAPALVAALADEKDRDPARPWLLYAGQGPVPASDVPLPPGTALPAAYYRWAAARVIEAARAVDAAHAAGVLHRDLSPANILIEAGTGQVRVCDFGLGVRVLTSDADGREVPTPCARNGTPGYSAPEVVTAGIADRRSDVYGLGACLRELLTLTKFGAETAPAAPVDLLAVTAKALSSAPADRYPTAGALADDLQRYLDRRPTAARWGWAAAPRALALWFRRNLRWTVPGATALAALVALVVAGFAVQRAETERELERVRERAFGQSLVWAQDAIRDTPPFAGWSQNTRDRFRDIKRTHPDADIRDNVGPTLIGADIDYEYEHSIPWYEKSKNPGLGEVVFSPDGKRVLAAPWWEPGRVLAPALLWDGNVANKPVPAARAARGPVAFPEADSPLQLALTDKAQPALPLVNVGTGATVLEIALPAARFVEVAALSADARFAVATLTEQEGGKDPITVLWALDRKARVAKKVAEWPGRAEVFAFAPPTPDAPAALLATGAADGEVVVRATADGAKVLEFREHELRVSALAFGRNFLRPSGERPAPQTPADGWLLAVGSEGGRLSVWNLRRRERLNAFYGSTYGVYGLSFSPDGTRLLSSGRSFPFLWDVAAGKPLLRLRWHDGGDFNWAPGVAFAPDGTRLAIGSATPFVGGGLHVMRLNEDRGVRTYRGLTGGIEKVWPSQSGKYVAALAQNWQLGVWERGSGRAVGVWDVPAGITADNSAAVFDPDEKEVLFASGERVSRWNLDNGARTGSWKVPRGLNDSLAVRPGKKPLLVRAEDVEGKKRALRARELDENGKMTDLYTIPGVPSTNTLLADDGRLLLANLAGYSDHQNKLFDAATGKEIPTAAVWEGRAAHGWVSPSGKVLVAGEYTRDRLQAVVLELPSLKRLKTHPRLLHRADDSGRLGVSCVPSTGQDDSPDNGVALYRVGEDRPLVTFDLRRPPCHFSVGISADGRTVFWGRADGTVCVADVNKCLEQLAPFGKR